MTLVDGVKLDGEWWRQKAGLITPFVLKHFQTDFPEKQSQGGNKKIQQKQEMNQNACLDTIKYNFSNDKWKTGKYTKYVSSMLEYITT